MESFMAAKRAKTKDTEKWPADQVERRDLASLVPYANNARTHSKAQVEQLAASIREWGWTVPVLVDEDEGIIAGHGRVLAAQELGITEVPVMVASGWSEAQKRAYIIADNKLTMNAEWNDDLLKLELNDLNGMDFDISLTGFSDDDLATLFKKETEGLTDPDEIPDAPETPVTRPGDVWLLGVDGDALSARRPSPMPRAGRSQKRGVPVAKLKLRSRHRVMCGDSTAQSDVDKLMVGERGDLLFTDPPWNVNYGAVKAGNAQGYKPRKILNDNMDEADWVQFVAGFCASFYAATKPGAPAYVVMSAQEWPAIDKGLREAKFHWSSTIIWVKDALVLSRKDYHTQYEPLWYGWNKDGPRIMPVADRKQSDIWNIARPRVSALHPTTKPVQLIERAVLNSSACGALVVDLFGGSGSTLIACEQQHRRCRLMEIDPKYVDVALERWQAFTSQQATLEGDGRSFAEIRTERLGTEDEVDADEG
jgi:DNA modification methylase